MATPASSPQPEALQARIAELRSHLQAHPEQPLFWSELAGLLLRAGRPQPAVDAADEALRLAPALTAALECRAQARMALGQFPDAEADYRAFFAAGGGGPLARLNLAQTRLRQGHGDEALALTQQVAERNPHLPEAHLALAVVREERGDLELALACLRRALELTPGEGRTLAGGPEGGRTLAGGPEGGRTLAGGPDIPAGAPGTVPTGAALTYFRLGALLLRLLQVEEAQAAYRAGLLRSPNAPRMRSAYLYTYLYVEAPPQQVHAEHVAWARLHAAPLRPPADRPNSRDPERLLQIGLVAPTFSAHAGGIMGRGLIENFNPREIAVTCYSDVTAPDHLTSHYRSRATRWREVLHLDDEGLAAQVRADGIDILVDRTGHAAGSRLGVFARKPAPIQVSYLEYMNTTGLDTIDYWLSDPLATPLSLQPYYTERIWHLERCLGLYSPPPESPPVTPLPALRNGFVTFAVFNNPLKIQGRTVPLMARVLQALPTARLLFKYGAWERPDVVNRMRDAFARAGVAPGRLTFAGRSSRYGYLAAFGGADIGLDTFPNNGFTTTLESLWMGVPVVNLRGETTVSRIGHSFLTALGRPQWVASNDDEYVAGALALAADLPALAAIRAGLRNEMASSPLRDGPGHARSLERAFRAMWRIWCAGGGA